MGREPAEDALDDDLILVRRAQAHDAWLASSSCAVTRPACGGWRSSVTVDATTYGAEVSDELPAPTDIPGPAPSGSSALLHPFGPAVSEALRSNR